VKTICFIDKFNFFKRNKTDGTQTIECYKPTLKFFSKCDNPKRETIKIHQNFKKTTKIGKNINKMPKLVWIYNKISKSLSF
jgi:hypothetical protein